MQSFNGIYENGVIRFPGRVDIPEGAKVTVAVSDASPPQPPLGCNSPELYALLGERFNSGTPTPPPATTSTSRNSRPSPGLRPGVAHHAGGTSPLLHADPLAEPGARVRRLLARHDLAG